MDEPYPKTIITYRRKMIMSRKLKRITGIEFMMACNELAGTSGKLFAGSFRFETESGNYKISARYNGDINYVSMESPEGKYYQIKIDMIGMKVESATVSPKYASEEVSDLDIKLARFEENDLPEEWQPALTAFSTKYLGPAIEVKWNDRIIDLIDEVNINHGTMFIIPNSACAADQFLIEKDEKADEAKAIAELNGCEYDRSSTKLVQIWMSSCRGDWYVDNLQCHNPCIEDKDGNKYYFGFPSFIPETVLSKFQEGKLDLLKFPVEVNKALADYEPDGTYNSHHLTAVVNFKFIPAQTITRYSFCGKFEDALKRVTDK